MWVRPDVAEQAVSCQQHADSSDAAFLHVDVFPVVPLPAWEETAGLHSPTHLGSRSAHLFAPFSLNLLAGWESSTPATWVGPSASPGPAVAAPEHLQQTTGGSRC